VVQGQPCEAGARDVVASVASFSDCGIILVCCAFTHDQTCPRDSSPLPAFVVVRHTGQRKKQ
jgi:hypothetical protein